jgi:lipopolysaccharide export LptBFGC system permease protein LptF
MPIAVLAGALVGLGLLARNNEFVALRSCGVSLWQITLPLVALGVLIGLANFLWGETVVPVTARRAQEIWSQDVKKKQGTDGRVRGPRRLVPRPRRLLQHQPRRAPAPHAVRPHDLSGARRRVPPTRVIDIATAEWTDGGWQFNGARTVRYDADGVHAENALPPHFTLPRRSRTSA